MRKRYCNCLFIISKIKALKSDLPDAAAGAREDDDFPLCNALQFPPWVNVGIYVVVDLFNNVDAHDGLVKRGSCREYLNDCHNPGLFLSPQ